MGEQVCVRVWVWVWVLRQRVLRAYQGVAPARCCAQSSAPAARLPEGAQQAAS